MQFLLIPIDLIILVIIIIMMMNKIIVKNNECCLCNAINDSLLNREKSLIENRLIFESEHFITIPSLGPFVEGQIMIVSKKHFANLSSMHNSVIKDLLEVFGIVKNRTKLIYNSDLVFAEHGAYDNVQKGGACVLHTHIHCIPNYVDGIIALKSQLNLLYSGHDLYELWKVKNPYIFIFNSANDKIYIFHAENVPSQMIRKTFLAYRGINDNWNWRSNYDYELINRTLEKWILMK